ncbi:hypothetical protein B0H63DRAFT_565871 [Podospora didyma]|uniref:Fungal-type protein kinase domain-containing protein n=1 Tax=Podospora didyma TaxID=330526 RepID=A0AAE0JYI2_9PEZI|nr:hypothetical protein B0H63DRAFT_565871 [Podospora didyma]
MDIGFVNDPSAGKNSRCHWIQILMPSELKSNPSADIPSEAQLREVLAAQDTRRFDLGFTLCRSLMRIWVSNRLGGIASEQFDINKDGLRFVSTILGFLWMSEEELGFDPTIMLSLPGVRYRSGLWYPGVVPLSTYAQTCVLTVTSASFSTVYCDRPAGYHTIARRNGDNAYAGCDRNEWQSFNDSHQTLLVVSRQP